MKATPENVFFADLKDTLAVPIHAPSGKQDLLRQIYAGLKMPSEAGLNWDALDEVLHDLSWIREKDIVLLHSGFDALDGEDLEVYAEILSSAAGHWKGRRKHRLYLLLPEKMRALLPSSGA